VLIAPEKVSPEVLSRLTFEQLRSAGLSSQKATYLHDLAAKVADGTVQLKTVGRKSDEEIIAELIQVKGIGRWTAQMFLIFSLGRPDVFPPDDLGIKVALRNLYGLAELPTKAEAHALAAPWTPHSTFATWYLWRSLDLAKAKKVG
jgi:DNA-3-methyladenine glycosylase II